MNLVTIIWSMVMSACLTLAAMSLLVWLKERTAWSNLLIFLMAASTAGISFCELSMMMADTPAEFSRAVWWGNFPVWIVIVSLVLFVRLYLRSGRAWLAWTVIGMRTLAMILNFVLTPNLNYREISSLLHLRFLGESVSVARGVPNPWLLIAQVAVLLLVIFVVDAAVSIRRRKSQRRSLVLISGILFFLVASLMQSVLVFRGILLMPITFSFFSLGIVSVLAYEMSQDVRQAAQLAQSLGKSEAALRSSKEDLQKLAGRLISAQEEELRRLSRELHDDLTQRLAVLAIEAGKLEMDLNRMPEKGAETVRAVARMKNQLIKVSEDVHTISRQLHPTILDDLGLVRAIESECAAFMRRNPVKIAFRKENVPDDIPDDIALCLYRVVQEGLKNIATHSGAKNGEILLKGNDHAICLTVSDEGIGFDLLEVRSMPGLGLSSMRERVQLVQGEFSIRSQPGKGTVVNVCLPYTGSDA
jgi:signal transduction histidine kinase